ncbi:hypothetical protein D1624_29960, partial [Klebsiella pneumoniae]
GLGLLLALLVGLIPFVGGLVIAALYPLCLSLGLKQTLVYKNETSEQGTSTFWVTLGMYVLTGIMSLGALALIVAIAELLRLADIELAGALHVDPPVALRGVDGVRGAAVAKGVVDKLLAVELHG